MTDLLASLSASLRDGDAGAVGETTARAVDAGVPPSDILNMALLPAMAAVGERFRTREIFLPDVLLAARAMQAAMARVRPLLLRDDVARAGTIVVGTVAGDVHDIGKNLVATLLQGAGFEVIDLGTDVPTERFVDAALDAGAPVIGMSALLTTTMIGMKNVVDLLRDRGLSGRIATIVGGAPVSAEFARDIGADAWAPDASAAVDRVRELFIGGCRSATAD